MHVLIPLHASLVVTRTKLSLTLEKSYGNSENLNTIVLYTPVIPLKKKKPLRVI